MPVNTFGQPISTGGGSIVPSAPVTSAPPVTPTPTSTTVNTTGNQTGTGAGAGSSGAGTQTNVSGAGLDPFTFMTALSGVSGALETNNSLMQQRQLLIKHLFDSPLTPDQVAKLPTDVQAVVNSGNKDAIELQLRVINDAAQGRANTFAQTVQYLTTGYQNSVQNAEKQKNDALSSLLSIAQNFVIPPGQPGAGQVDVKKLQSAFQSLYPGIDMSGFITQLQGMMPVSEYNKQFYQGSFISPIQLQNQATDPASMAMQSIVGTESGGDYNATSQPIVSGQYAGHQSYGKYQVLDVHIPEWTLAAGLKGSAPNGGMTPQEFLANPQAQDAVAKQQFQNLWNKYGNIQDVASEWFTGMPYAQAKAAGAKDPTTGMTLDQYVNNATAAFNHAQSQSTQATQLGLLSLPPAQPLTPTNIAAWQAAQAVMDGNAPPPSPTGFNASSNNAIQMRAYWQANKFDASQAVQDWDAVLKQIASGNSISADRARSSETTAQGYISTLQNMVSSSGGTFTIGGKTYKDWNNASNATPLTWSNYQSALQGLLGPDAQATAQAITTEIQDLTVDMATVYRFGLTPTQSSIDAASHTLQSYWGNNRLEATLPVLSQNLQARLGAFTSQITSPVTPSGGQNLFTGDGSSGGTNSDPLNLGI